MCRIFIKLRIYKISIVKFEPQTLKFKNLKVKQFKHTSVSHKLKMNVIAIFYNHYLLKMSKLKNQVPKLRFKFNSLFNNFVAKSDWRI